MKYVLLLGSALVLCISLGDCLQCYTCAVSTSRCITNPMNCTGANERCFYRVGKAGSITVYSGGCTDPSKCNQTMEGSFGNMNVSLSTTCCRTDLCNGGSHVKPSLLLGFAMVSLWFTRFL